MRARAELEIGPVEDGIEREVHAVRPHGSVGRQRADVRHLPGHRDRLAALAGGWNREGVHHEIGRLDRDGERRRGDVVALAAQFPDLVVHVSHVQQEVGAGADQRNGAGPRGGVIAASRERRSATDARDVQVASAQDGVGREEYPVGPRGGGRHRGADVLHLEGDRDRLPGRARSRRGRRRDRQVGEFDRDGERRRHSQVVRFRVVAAIVFEDVVVRVGPHQEVPTPGRRALGQGDGRGLGVGAPDPDPAGEDGRLSGRPHLRVRAGLVRRVGREVDAIRPREVEVPVREPVVHHRPLQRDRVSGQVGTRARRHHRRHAQVGRDAEDHVHRVGAGRDVVGFEAGAELADGVARIDEHLDVPHAAHLGRQQHLGGARCGLPRPEHAGAVARREQEQVAGRHRCQIVGGEVHAVGPRTGIRDAQALVARGPEHRQVGAGERRHRRRRSEPHVLDHEVRLRFEIDDEAPRAEGRVVALQEFVDLVGRVGDHSDVARAREVVGQGDERGVVVETARREGREVGALPEEHAGRRVGSRCVGGQQVDAVPPDRGARRSRARVQDAVTHRDRRTRQHAGYGDRLDDRLQIRLGQLQHLDGNARGERVVGLLDALGDRVVHVGPHQDPVVPGSDRVVELGRPRVRRAGCQRRRTAERAEDGIAAVEHRVVGAVDPVDPGDRGGHVALVLDGPGDREGLLGEAFDRSDDRLHGQVRHGRRGAQAADRVDVDADARTGLCAAAGHVGDAHGIEAQLVGTEARVERIQVKLVAIRGQFTDRHIARGIRDHADRSQPLPRGGVARAQRDQRAFGRTAGAHHGQVGQRAGRVGHAVVGEGELETTAASERDRARADGVGAVRLAPGCQRIVERSARRRTAAVERGVDEHAVREARCAGREGLPREHVGRVQRGAQDSHMAPVVPQDDIRIAIAVEIRGVDPAHGGHRASRRAGCVGGRGRRTQNAQCGARGVRVDDLGEPAQIEVREDDPVGLAADTLEHTRREHAAAVAQEALDAARTRHRHHGVRIAIAIDVAHGHVSEDSAQRDRRLRHERTGTGTEQDAHRAAVLRQDEVRIAVAVQVGDRQRAGRRTQCHVSRGRERAGAVVRHEGQAPVRTAARVGAAVGGDRIQIPIAVDVAQDHIAGRRPHDHRRQRGEGACSLVTEGHQRRSRGTRRGIAHRNHDVVVAVAVQVSDRGGARGPACHRQVRQDTEHAATLVAQDGDSNGGTSARHHVPVTVAIQVATRSPHGWARHVCHQWSARQQTAGLGRAGVHRGEIGGDVHVERRPGRATEPVAAIRRGRVSGLEEGIVVVQSGARGGARILVVGAIPCGAQRWVTRDEEPAHGRGRGARLPEHVQRVAEAVVEPVRIEDLIGIGAQAEFEPGQVDVDDETIERAGGWRSGQSRDREVPDRGA